MGEVKQININNRTIYFYNDMTDLKSFDGRLLKVDKKVVQKQKYLHHWIYYN